MQAKIRKPWYRGREVVDLPAAGDGQGLSHPLSGSEMGRRANKLVLYIHGCGYIIIISDSRLDLSVLGELRWWVRRQGVVVAEGVYKLVPRGRMPTHLAPSRCRFPRVDIRAQGLTPRDTIVGRQALEVVEN
ncbi:hypothetical protein V2A60_001703 [Cordyceps javanica]